jgi:hypothetical protein
MNHSSTLVIVPCGRSKIWDKNPDIGYSPAKDAYVGSPFKVNRKYAECFGNEWVILSAKYGFVLPDFALPGPYEVTFKRKSSGPVLVDVLRQQINKLSLGNFSQIVGLGGKEYRAAIVEAFAKTDIEVHFPFAGLPIGKAMQAIKQAIEKSVDQENVSREHQSIGIISRQRG